MLHEETRIIVQSLPVGAGEACSGMNVLQSMLIAGSALAFLFIGRYRSYWWNIPVLVIIAWLANTSRIIILCAAALTLGSEFALGIFHTWGGWIVLALMLFLSWAVSLPRNHTCARPQPFRLHEKTFSHHAPHLRLLYPVLA
ncbi:MAG TPA: archaeosortase/exosortase family protein [Desulfomonilia bacterium]|nr:archaeosortase/exosortase family protein [Deltaproteobacteria bacterium]HPX17940.1 archaeosortase/exosortase family protein [Deltaproteobacteria bacterium]HRS54874.1 archaeosortase/exosortase family protein [Desulfomonilia bacterium]HRV34371.1 archaeosortase/exosortase family protein [Desulfomonilia bacterium]